MVEVQAVLHLILFEAIDLCYRLGLVENASHKQSSQKLCLGNSDGLERKDSSLGSD